ncbi:peptidyl serine alpha-galactosyltransferase-like [Gossypium arboreum]|uniref:peptidyl serine alpha-galactosyltransferase-like n=1 Tax=Gossypium arboreum TaxID=29729 RepID=UPI0008195699|nr:peptidyl serine alpha-galactosyltransferase-like [Gossypium arboreum]
MHSFRKAQQPGPVTRLLNCTDEEKKNYKGVDAPTLEVPSMRRHPKTGDWYSVRCDNILAKLHTEHPEVCNKVGGLLAMHIDGLRVLAHLWLSKTEEVPEDQAHWETNITGDIYGEGWISEMYGYLFGAAEAGLSLPFSVGNRSFSKLEHHEDGIVYGCRQLFPKPPYPREVKAMELDPNKRRGLFLSIECINTMNEGLLLQHARHGCPMPKWSKYLSFLKSKTFVELTHPKLLTPRTVQTEVAAEGKEISEPTKKFTLFSTECIPYFDWQAV